MDVLPGVKAVDHGPVPGHAGQQPQLDLGVVRIHQHPARRGHEHLPQLGPQLGADGDVLQIRLGGGQAARGGDGVLKTGVDTPVGGDDLAQAVCIGGLQLGQLAIFQYLPDDGVGAPQLVQHVGVGGIARLGLFYRGQAQLVKEDAAQLLGGVDVELLPRQVEDIFLGGLDAAGEHLPEFGQGLAVNEKALLLHLRQHGAQGQLHRLIQFPHAQLLQPPGQHRLQCGDEGTVG